MEPNKNQIDASNHKLIVIDESSISKIDMITEIENFTKLLNESPDPSIIKKGPDGKSDEIPISFIEAKLDEIYMRQWGYDSCIFSVFANEICCDIMLYVIDPLTKNKIVKAGTAALPIMMDALPDRLKFMTADTPERIAEEETKAKERNSWALDVQNKKPFAMKLQRGAVKQLALKNACKSLGIIFGRNLNRAHTDFPESFYSNIINNENDLHIAKTQIMAATSEEDFNLIWETWEDLQNEIEFQKNFMYFKRKNIKRNDDRK